MQRGLVHERHFESALDLLECLSPSRGFAGADYGAEKWLYRGHGSELYELIPSAFRAETRLPCGDRGKQESQTRAVASARGMVPACHLPASSCDSIHIVTAPAASNPNLRAQRGVFLVLLQQDAVLDEYFGAEPYDRLALKRHGGNTDIVFRFTLPILEADELLRLLAKENVTAAALFPGWDGVIRALNESRYWPALSSWHESPRSLAAAAYQGQLLQQVAPRRRARRRAVRQTLE